MRIDYRRIAGAFVLCTAVASANPAHATGDTSTRLDRSHDAVRNSDTDPRLEINAGSDHTADSDFGHGALIWAFRQSLYEEGWRLRVMGGIGGYSYDGALRAGHRFLPQRFRGDVTMGEALLGHQWRRGTLFVKIYGGGQYVHHDISPPDPHNETVGSAFGAKVLTEIWYSRGRTWVSADVSYATAFGDYRAQLRLAYRPRRRVSFGAEAGALGNRTYDAGRLGGFVRMHWRKLEATLAAGVTGDYIDTDPSPYVSLDLVHKY